MHSQWLELAGGLGVFLLGVVIMTNGLKGVAGDALRAALTRFTRSPTSGACTGAVSTAILQSSSATTVAAVGFVGAGLLTFPQALGIIFGANIGTTITGWLVALLGFKLKLGTAVLPLILVGVLLHMFGKGRLSHAGLSLAGFGLIFVGITAMQSGMSGLEGRITPDSFPSDTLIGRLQLVFIGIGITLITQSSSAGVATAITAVYTGTISFEQGAALVIGMDVGTTATALVATIGGSVESRRTGMSHVIYNLMTGTGAFLLLTPYVYAWQTISPGTIYAQTEIALVAFHTSFNILGVFMVVPFTRQFASMVIRMVPERTSTLASHLDKRLLSEPFIALEAVRATLEDIHVDQLAYGINLINNSPAANPEKRIELEQGLELTQDYLDQIHSEPGRAREWQFLMACMHSLNHMQRLQHRLAENRRAKHWQDLPLLKVAGEQISQCFSEISSLVGNGKWSQASELAASVSAQRNEQANTVREQIMSLIASGSQNADTGDDQLESARWLRRVAEHLWRISHHMHLADELSHKETDMPQVNPA